jgi:peptidyl-prolyl cis-trans isomerase SurA
MAKQKESPMWPRLGIVLLVLLAAAVAARAEIIEQILVKVNGEIFTKSDLEQRQVVALRQKGQQIDLKSDTNNVQLRKALDEVTPQIMVDAIDEMVIVQRGKELGYKLSDEQFKNVVENIRKENKIETDEQFQAALKSENMTLADLRRNLERQMIVQRVQQNEVIGKIGVTDEEARKYYDSHMNEFTTPQSVTLREIVVALPVDDKGLNVAADEAAKAKIEDLRTRVTTGSENFQKLAGEVSDAPSKANAGLIGPISLNDIAPDLRKLIESMKVGDVSNVIRNQRGYQIL